MRQIVGFSLLCLVGGCTYSAQTQMVSAPASEVRSDRRSDLPASVYFDPGLDSLSAEAVKNSYDCSAHNFPITVGPAIKSSLLRVLEESFQAVDVRRSPQFDQPNVVDIRVRAVSFQPMVSFSSGFWSKAATARAELVLRVSAALNGQEIISPTTIAGEGSSMGVSGSCGKGAEAMNLASTDAVKRTMEAFVYKIVNSGDMRTASGQAVTVAAPVVPVRRATPTALCVDAANPASTQTAVGTIPSCR